LHIFSRFSIVLFSYETFCPRFENQIAIALLSFLSICAILCELLSQFILKCTTMNMGTVIVCCSTKLKLRTLLPVVSITSNYVGYRLMVIWCVYVLP